MKKIKLIGPFLLSLILIFTAACGSKNYESSVISEKMHSYGESAVKLADEYLDSKTDYKTVGQQLSGIAVDVQQYITTEESKRYREDGIVAARIATLLTTVSLVESKAQEREELIILRNNLADKLNMEERPY